MRESRQGRVAASGGNCTGAYPDDKVNAPKKKGQNWHSVPVCYLLREQAQIRASRGLETKAQADQEMGDVIASFQTKIQA